MAEVEKQGLSRVEFMAILALLVTVGFFGLVVLMVFYDLPQAAEQFLTMIGGGGFLAVINYYFGSSKGSADKNKTIADAINK